MRLIVLTSMIAVRAGFAQAQPAKAITPDYASKVSLTYSCKIAGPEGTGSEAIDMQLALRNDNTVPIFKVRVKYWVRYSGGDAARATDPEPGDVIGSVEMSAPEQFIEHTSKNIHFSPDKGMAVRDCLAHITSFEAEVPKVTKEQEVVRLPNRVVIAPDCREDVKKLDSMKPGLAKRQYLAELLRSGCISYEPTYAKRPKLVKTTITVPVSMPPNDASKQLAGEENRVEAERRRREEAAEEHRRDTTLKSRPILLSKSEPQYSEEARRAKAQGRVEIQIEIREDGTATVVSVLRGDPLLIPLAIEALKSWRFAPARSVSGKPMRWAATVEVLFLLL